MFSRSDLDELVAIDARPAVSLYLPTHLAGREIRQDPIRLKNLLSSTAERLAATWRRPEIDDFLGPAEHHWSEMKSSGAISSKGCCVSLAHGFRPHPQIADPGSRRELSRRSFLFQAPAPAIRGRRRILAADDQRQTYSRLYHGSRWEFGEDKTIDLPQGVGKIRAMTDYEETQYASPVGRRGTLAHAQSFGEAPEELRRAN